MQDPTKFVPPEEPVSIPVVFMPDDGELNFSTDPLPPPRARYKRDVNMIPDNESWVSSDWNFVQPGY
jgi:hypothetical protein